MLSDLALVLTTAIWGSTFITVKQALASLTPMRFVALRFAFAALVLFVVALAARARFDRATWRAGAIAAVPFYLTFLTQTFGLVWASPATSAFLTGVSVVLVPVFSVLLLGRRISVWTWAGVCVAFAGLGLLALRGGGRLSLGPGEAWTVGTAVAVAAHILVLERFSPGKSALALTAVQVLGCAVLGLLCTPLDGLLLGRPGGPLLAGLSGRLLGVVLYMACAATALTFFLQTWAQARIPATRVGVLFALEPVFALVFSLLAGAERLAPRAALGMGLILAGMLLVETLGRREAGA